MLFTGFNKSIMGNMGVIPGQVYYPTPGSYSFSIPRYNFITFELWGAGGGGCAVGSFAYAGGNNGGSSSISTLSLLAGGGRGGGSVSGGAGGVATGGSMNITGDTGGGGYNGDRGGRGGAAGNGGYGGGGPSYHIATGAGPTGNSPGGGGAPGTNPDGGFGAGGGGGAYCRITYTRGVGSAPLPTLNVAMIVGAGGPLQGAQPYWGGAGAPGYIRITWN